MQYIYIYIRTYRYILDIQYHNNLFKTIHVPVCVCVERVSSTSFAASMACATSNSCHDIGQLPAAALIAVEKPKASPDSCCLGPVPASIS